MSKQTIWSEFSLPVANESGEGIALELNNRQRQALTWLEFVVTGAKLYAKHLTDPKKFPWPNQAMQIVSKRCFDYLQSTMPGNPGCEVRDYIIALDGTRKWLVEGLRMIPAQVIIDQVSHLIALYEKASVDADILRQRPNP